VRLELIATSAGHHLREDEVVDQQQQERVDERPEEPEDGPSIARLQLTGDERANQRTITKKLSEMGEQSRLVARGLSASRGGPDKARPTVEKCNSHDVQARVRALAATWSRMSDFIHRPRGRSKSMSI